MKILIIILVLIVGVIGFLSLNENPIATEIKEMIENDVVTSWIDNSNTKVAELVAVDGSESFGKGYRLVESGKLKHSVVATMPDLKEGNFYEGWLVQINPLLFFSTGVMEKREDGKWVIEYETNGEFPTHNRVVITEETVVDATPEKHIIEGDFNI